MQPCRSQNALALDHLTITDATPLELVDLAVETGCRAVCLFLESMEVLPLMPQFSLLHGSVEVRETKARMQALGIGCDLAYPFTLSARTRIEDFHPYLEAAAALGAKAVNVLHYDREPARLFESFAAFSALAKSYRLKVALEFYPPSQVKSLADGLSLVTKLNEAEQAGVNVDLLHLMRSGGTLAELRAVSAEFLHYAQYCDGFLYGPSPGMSLEEEASRQRLLPGQGGFDLAGFAAALPQGIRASVEVPRDAATQAGEPKRDRVRRAVELTLGALL